MNGTPVCERGEERDTGMNSVPVGGERESKDGKRRLNGVFHARNS